MKNDAAAGRRNEIMLIELNKEMGVGEGKCTTSFVGEISRLNYEPKESCIKKVGGKEIEFFVPVSRMAELEGLTVGRRKKMKLGRSRPCCRAMVFLLHCCHLAPHTRDDGEEWASLSSKYMRFICNDAKTWRQVWQALEAHGVIECDRDSKKGKKSFGYRLAPAWLDGVEWQRAGHFADWPNLSEGWREISYLDFDRSAAKSLLWRVYQMRREVPRYKKKRIRKERGRRAGKLAEAESLWVESTWDQETFEAILWRVDNFRRTYRICETGRLFTDANTLPKELRSLVTIMGEQTVELDVANCQPLLLWTLYPGDTLESWRYRKLAESGKLYETVRDAVLGASYDQVKDYLSETQRVEFERNNFKNRYFIPYLFGEGAANKMKPKIEAWFAKEFPELLEIISGYLAKGPAKLPRTLQKLESNLIWKSIDAAGIPHLSIHDGVRVRERDLAVARTVLEQSFLTKGLKPAIKPADVLEALLNFEKGKAAERKHPRAA